MSDNKGSYYDNRGNPPYPQQSPNYAPNPPPNVYQSPNGYPQYSGPHGYVPPDQQGQYGYGQQQPNYNATPNQNFYPAPNQNPGQQTIYVQQQKDTGAGGGCLMCLTGLCACCVLTEMIECCCGLFL